jgi:hypothetical protein
MLRVAPDVRERERLGIVFFRTLRGSGERAWVGAAESWYGSVAPSPFQPVRLDQIVPALNEQPRKVRKNLPQALVQTCIVHYADLRIMPPATWNPAPAAMIAAMGSA